MGKLLICSERSDYEKISSYFTDFTISAEGSGTFGQYVTYQKLRLPTKNCYRDGTNFAIGVGTFLYRGEKDSEALKGVLEDWTGDLSLRSNIIGSYCIGVYKNGIFSLFVDESATYKLYYYLDQDTQRFAATTTLYHLAKGLSCTTDDIAFLGDLFLSNICGNTGYPQIHWLTAGQVLEYRNSVWSLREVFYAEEPINGNFCEYIKEKYKDISKIFSKSGTFLTGGQDSRITLSLMLVLGLKPTCYYGIGNSTVTNTKNEDLKCVRRLAEQNDLPVQLMNWNDSDSEQKEEYLNKYGELYSMYGMSKNFFHEFEDSIESVFITFGYLGETFRAVETITSYPREEYTLSQYIDEIYLTNWKPCISDQLYPAFRDLIYQQYLAFCTAHGLDSEHLTKDNFQDLNSVYRLCWDMKMNQFANLFFYSFPLFGDRRALDYIAHVPYTERTDSKFQMKCIEAFTPSLLEIPFFSHIKPKVYNSQTHELTEEEITVLLKDRIKGCVSNPVLYRLCRYMYYVLRGDKKGLREIHALYQDSQKNEELLSGKPIRSLLCQNVSQLPVRTVTEILFTDFMRESAKSNRVSEGK